MAWRLGIDLGTNSLGWAALELRAKEGVLSPDGLMDSGVRIFSDGRNPKDKQSNAAQRREPRSARRNRDRSKRRSARLMRALIKYGLMPTSKIERKALEGDKKSLSQLDKRDMRYLFGNSHLDEKNMLSLCDSDPWALRTRALNEQITPFQFGRAIYHLHQRRGFKSNRKADRADKNESGKVKTAIRKTKEKMEKEGARTLGELFGRPRLETYKFNKTAPKGKRKAQPLARVRSRGTGAKLAYDYYPTRELIIDEFDQMWEKQKQYYERLNDEAHEIIRDIIEWQHPLKAQPVGKCTLIPEQERAPKALPSSQRARIFQEVNALKYGPIGKNQIALTKEQRDKITTRLLNPTSKTGKVSFIQIRKILDISSYDKFNTESDKRKDLAGDETAAKLMQEDRWGKDWLKLDLKTQDEIVDRLLNEEKEQVLIAWLMSEHGLDKEQAERVADCPLPDGYGNLSKLALDRILPPLEEEVIVYSDAVIKAGFDSHSQFGTGEIFDKQLPYYGYILERSVAFGTGNPNDIDEKRYGKIANPTVHVALNQIQKVVNDLMKRFGAPEQIVIELARDLPLSAKGKSELETQQKKNQDANEIRRKKLAEHGLQDNYENRMRLRLYEDLAALDHRCVFSGEPIGMKRLFSSEVEIEHILPFSCTFDDSYSNKTLSMRQANRDKGNKTPYEAFGRSPDGYNWEEISKRAAELPKNKAWRFSPDAMERYKNVEQDFLARQLNDTRYISRLAKNYLEAIYGGQGHAGSKNHVWVINGSLTADLRWQWGLDSVLHGHNLEISEAQKKNRNDHRHHAIDAIVIACTDRAMLKKASDAAKKIESNPNSRFDRLMSNTPEPWDNFRNDVEDCVRNIIVSHKPDHGFEGAMHNDTAYGIDKAEKGTNNARLVVTRKPLDSFEKVSDLEKIRDDIIREKLIEETYGLKGKDFKEALLNAGRNMQPPVYKVRIEAKLKVIPIKDKQGNEYKAYKGDSNYCYDIWADEKGKWVGEVISTFDAYQLARKDKVWWQKPIGRNGKKLIMRIRKNDHLQIEHEEKEKLVQVVKFSTGMIAMAEHFEANVDARTRDKNDGLKFIFKAPSSLQSAKAKRVTLSPSGVVKIYD